MSEKRFCDVCDKLMKDEKLKMGSLHLYGKEISIHFDICDKCIKKVTETLFINKEIK